jgi:hypothetical protein
MNLDWVTDRCISPWDTKLILADCARIAILLATLVSSNTNNELA